jgi:hypothetical protein
MEFTIRTMMIMVVAVITLLIVLTIIFQGQGQSIGILDGLFEWFRDLV